MSTTRVDELVRLPVTYDIIIGDFGRDATIEYLRLMAAYERSVLEPVLRREGREFFDEYRRIMFAVLGDLAFFKKPAIAASVQGRGYFTDAILVGVGFTPPSADFIENVAISVVYEVVAALAKGYERLRIAVPCNGLSALATEVGRILRSESELHKLTSSRGLRILDIGQVVAAKPTVHTVPESVMAHLVRRSERASSVLLLGTQGTNAIYRELASSQNVRVLPISDVEYAVINRAIVAAIGGDPDAIASSRQQLRSAVIEQHEATCPDLVIVEACTDFRLGLGLSSLELFAEAMVADAYSRRT